MSYDGRKPEPHYTTEDDDIAALRARAEAAEAERDRLASDRPILVKQVVDLTAERDALREALGMVTPIAAAFGEQYGLTDRERGDLAAARALLSAAPKGDKP